MRSIRARILGLVLGVLVLSLTAISLKSYFDAQHEIEELFDAQLAQTARILQGMVGGEMPPATRELMQRALNSALLSQRAASEALPANGHPYEGKLAFQVLDDSGQVLLQSASAPADLLRRMIVDFHQQAPQPHAHQGDEPLSSTGVDLLGYHTVPLGRYHWRVFMLHDQLAGKWIMVAERDDVRGELVDKIAMRSLLPDLLGLPLLEYRGIVLDPSSQLVTWQGQSLSLPRKEFLLLHELLVQPGRVLTRDRLQQVLYGWDEEVESNALEVHVHHLRKKFFPELIRTVRGVGYMAEKA